MPLYLSVPVQWFVNWMQMDRSAVVDLVATRKLYLASAMNHMVNDALSRDIWDRLVVMEADMLPPLQAFNRIAQYPDTPDVVGSMYFQHVPPYHPLAYQQVDDEHYKPLARNQVDEMMAAPGMYPVDAVGLGFTSIHRRVLENWDPDIPMFGGENALGHDMWFCRAARRQGFTVHVDTGIECGHLTEMPITYENTKQ
jgi:hypothetical protein